MRHSTVVKSLQWQVNWRVINGSNLTTVKGKQHFVSQELFFIREYLGWVHSPSYTMFSLVFGLRKIISNLVWKKKSYDLLCGNIIHNYLIVIFDCWVALAVLFFLLASISIRIVVLLNGLCAWIFTISHSKDCHFDNFFFLIIDMWNHLYYSLLRSRWQNHPASTYKVANYRFFPG